MSGKWCRKMVGSVCLGRRYRQLLYAYAVAAAPVFAASDLPLAAVHGTVLAVVGMAGFVLE